MRTRSRPLDITLESVHKRSGGFTNRIGDVNPDPWSLVKPPTIRKTSLRYSQSMTDTEIPNFHNRRNRGEIFCNPMVSDIVKVEDASPMSARGSFVQGKKFFSTDTSPNCANYGALEIQGHLIPDLMIQNGWNVFTNSLFFKRMAKLFPISSEHYKTLRSTAFTGALADQSQAAANLLVSVGEGKESLEMIANCLRTVLGSLRALKRADWQYFRKKITRKQLENLYLETKYGWLPLIRDCRELAGAFSRRYADRATARGYASYSSAHSDALSIPVSAYTFNQYKGTLSLSLLCDVKVRSGILLSVDNSMGDLQRALGALEVIPAVYDLLPLSFVVDWFINLGDCIAALSPHVGTKPLCGWSVITSTYVLKADLTVDLRSVMLDGTVNHTGTVHTGDAFFGVSSSDFSEGGRESLTVSGTRKERVNEDTSAFPSLNWDIHLDVLKLVDLSLFLRNLVPTLKLSSWRKKR